MGVSVNFGMLHVALKEWAITCDLLLEGSLALLLRKGGIHEDKGPGRFELEHDRFALFPSWAHQKPEMVKDPLRGRVQVLQEPATITLAAWAHATDVWRVPDRTRLEQLDDLHCWTAAHLDMRFSYKPQNPLYLVAVRTYRLDRAKTVKNHAQYAGCKSWVPLRTGDEVDDAGSPVRTDAQHAAIVQRVTATFQPTA